MFHIPLDKKIRISFMFEPTIRAFALVLIYVIFAPAVVSQSIEPPNLNYPPSKVVDQIDDYHGTKIADPFRWLEDVDSPDTKQWVLDQNQVTFGYLKRIPERESLATRLSELWNFERFGYPTRHGKHWLYTHNDGLQNQNILYKAADLDAPRVVLLDPNRLSEEGTTALTGFEPSENGEWIAYGIAKAGSDWNTWKVRNIETGADLADSVEWVKFSTVAWTSDSQGFFYSRYDKPASEAEFTGVNYFQKLYYHRIGTPQSDDRLVYERKDQKEWGFRALVTDDGKFLVISVWRGTERKNLVFYASLQGGKVPSPTDIVELRREFDAEYEFLGNDESLFYFETDFDAPKRRIIAIDIEKSAPSNWKVVVPEQKESIESTKLFGNQLLITYLQDATSLVRRFDLTGRQLTDLEIPPLGTVAGFEGKRESAETFFSFTNYVTPMTLFRLDLASGKSSVWKRPKLAFDPDDFATERVFYTSKDGTRIPMILSYKKGQPKASDRRAFLYAYGGFNISVTPSFSPANLAWMEQGGLYAVPNLRGGGEYGREWHESGMLDRKQNVFDDYLSAAEFLIDHGYTNPKKLAIHGRSNGGLLVGAAMTQRPELFAVALPGVGVMDMLRFHKFTIGWAWVSEYGSSDNPSQFQVLNAYSPLHNLKPGTRYPATMVTTADHDDRVVPGHSFKFAARLQACQSGNKPALIRIETSAGHGAGTPVRKLVDAAADMWAFVIDNTR